MFPSLASWMKKWPLVSFYLLAFLFTWLGWVPQAAYSHNLFPFNSILFYILGGTGPLLALFVMQRILVGRWDIGELFRPYLIWKVGAGWYAAAFLGYPLIWAAALLVAGTLKTELAALGSAFSVITAFVVSFAAAIPEEMAWRGFALPRVQARTNALAASLITGVFWALWHLPLLMIKGSVMAAYPFVPYFVAVIATSVIYAWLFNNTRCSLLLITIFHAASNSVGPFAGTAQTIVLCAAALILAAVFGPERLTRKYEKRTVQQAAG